MGKIMQFKKQGNKEADLQEIYRCLGELKDALADVMFAYEKEDADPAMLDSLTDALDALEDAGECMSEALD